MCNDTHMEKRATDCSTIKDTKKKNLAQQMHHYNTEKQLMLWHWNEIPRQTTKPQI